MRKFWAKSLICVGAAWLGLLIIGFGYMNVGAGNPFNYWTMLSGLFRDDPAATLQTRVMLIIFDLCPLAVLSCGIALYPYRGASNETKRSAEETSDGVWPPPPTNPK